MRFELCLCVAAVTALAGCASQGPRPGYGAPPTVLQDVYGVYTLSNGDTLRISREHNRYWAEMGRTGRVEIVPVDDLVFVERAGPLRYTFTTRPFDTEVSIDSMAPPTAYAAVLGTAAHDP
jgi:hypothetical protein